VVLLTRCGKAYEKKIMSTDITNIEESFNVPKIIPQYENEVRHPFFEPYRPEIEDFSRVSRTFTFVVTPPSTSYQHSMP
jgi:hypothetical protein